MGVITDCLAKEAIRTGQVGGDYPSLVHALFLFDCLDLASWVNAYHNSTYYFYDLHVITLFEPVFLVVVYAPRDSLSAPFKRASRQRIQAFAYGSQTQVPNPSCASRLKPRANENLLRACSCTPLASDYERVMRYWMQL